MASHLPKWWPVVPLSCKLELVRTLSDANVIVLKQEVVRPAIESDGNKVGWFTWFTANSPALTSDGNTSSLWPHSGLN